LGNILHPRANEGDELAREKKLKIAVLQRSQSSGQFCHYFYFTGMGRFAVTQALSLPEFQLAGEIGLSQSRVPQTALRAWRARLAWTS
jgi:hypothetical protein